VSILQAHTTDVDSPALAEYLRSVRGELLIISCDHEEAAAWAATASVMAEEMIIPSTSHLVRGGAYSLIAPEGGLRQLMKRELLEGCDARANAAYSQLLGVGGTPATYLLVGHGPCLQFCCQSLPDPAHEARLLNGAVRRLSEELLLRAASAGILAAVAAVNVRGLYQDPFRHISTLTFADLAATWSANI
jgi:hypothetical protein